MNKIALALIGATFTATSAVAGNPANFSGPYAGLSLGVGTFNAENKQTANTAAVAAGVPATTKENRSAKGVIGGIELGYQKAFPNCFLLGLGVYGDSSNIKGSTSVSARTAKLHLSNAFGAALKLGYVVGSALPYVKIGVESARWKDTGSILPDAFRRQGSKKHRLTGFGPALGVETKLSDRVNLGVEGRHLSYGRMKVVSNAAGGAQVIRKVKPTVMDVRVTLKYQFCGFGF